jgi:hypothetical protein
MRFPSDAPKIAIEMIHRVKADAGCWSFGWLIKNVTGQPIKFLAARLPHGQFRGPEKKLNPSLDVGPGASVRIGTSVLCDEPPGAVVENAFLILLCEWQDMRWRIFVRLRVTINQQGEPEPVSNFITTQQVGFSGI